MISLPEQNHGVNPNTPTSAPNNGPSGGHHMPPNFELDFDKFDMLSEFPELDHYHSQTTGPGTQNPSGGMIHHGASGPLLSSTMTATTPPGGGKRHHITEYSPDWAWSDVSRNFANLPIFIR